METRIVEQVKVYYLIMNPMTDRAESGRIAMMSTERDKLLSHYEGELVTPYDDDRFRKVFRQGGPLFCFYPIGTTEGVDTFGHGLSEDWVDVENLQTLKNKYYFI